MVIIYGKSYDYLSWVQYKGGLVSGILSSAIVERSRPKDLLNDLQDLIQDHISSHKSTNPILSEEEEYRLILEFDIKLTRAVWTIVKYLVENEIPLDRDCIIKNGLGRQAELPVKFRLDHSLFDYYKLLKEFHNYLHYPLNRNIPEWIFPYLSGVCRHVERFPSDRRRFIQSLKSKIYESKSKQEYRAYEHNWLLEDEPFIDSDSVTFKREIMNLFNFVTPPSTTRWEKRRVKFRSFGKNLRDGLTPQLFDEIKGLNSRRSLLLSLCKLQILTGPLWSVLPGMVEQFDLLQKAYELRAKQLGCNQEQHSLLPTCFDLAFATLHDDPMSSVYICEFSYFRDTLNYLEWKSLLREEEVSKLDEHTKKRLHYYQHDYNNFHFCCAEPPRELEFSCLGHYCDTEETTTTCPLLNRRFLFDREGRHWTDPKCSAVYDDEV